MLNLIRPDGQVELGLFPHPPNRINMDEYILCNTMDKPISGWRKKMRANQFQFIGLTGEHLILGVAIVDLKWVSNAFVYIYDPSTKTFEEFSWLMPFSLNTHVSNQPNNGTWSFKAGNNKIEMRAENGKRFLTLEIKNKLSVNICIDETDQYNPLALCCRAGYNGWVFTNKATGRTFTGSIKWQGRTINTSDLLASVDWSCGFMRRDTFWNWASLSYKVPNTEQVIGLNLAAGVNETSYTENALWINQELIKLDRVEFIFNRLDRIEPWKISTSDGLVDLTFIPEGKRQEKINAIILASNFTQVFGRFYGTVKNQHGDVFEINGGVGFCEDHFARW